MSEWREDKPATPRIGPLGWILVVLRILPFFVVAYGGLLMLLAARGGEGAI